MQGTQYAPRESILCMEHFVALHTHLEVTYKYTHVTHISRVPEAFFRVRTLGGICKYWGEALWQKIILGHSKGLK